MKMKTLTRVMPLLVASTVSAMQFQTLGFKSVSMGGAAVASSAPSLAVYNNPALLAKSKSGVEISLGAGASYQDYGAGASTKALDDSGFLDVVDKADNGYETLTQEDINTLIKGKNIIVGMDGDGVGINPQGYFGVQIHNFGFGVFASSDVTASAVVDQQHDQLIFKDNKNGAYYGINDQGVRYVSNETQYDYQSIEYAINNGLTYLDVRGIIVAEVPVGYARSFATSYGEVLVGGSLKYMRGYTYTQKYKIDNSNETENDSKKDKTSNAVGVDLGFAFVPTNIKDLTLAIVAKNLNAPEFDFVTGQKVKVDPQIRLGVAYDITQSLEVAADCDISSNKTFIKNFRSQMLGGGLNWHPTSWFSLRGGIMKNIDSSDNAGLTYTAGLGAGIKWFEIDLAGQYASKTESIDGTTVPEYAKVNLAIVSKW